MLKPPALRNLGQEINGADDAKIRRIVALMDQQSLPPAAQAILDPLRPRLALLRPPRPLRFARLLFLPLDPVIVASRDWRVGDATVPRGAIPAVAETVHAAMGRDATEIDQLITDQTTANEAIIATAGARLWPRAGVILGQAPAPVGWDESGLPESAYPPMARAIGSVLTRADDLRTLERDAAIGAIEPNDDMARSVIAGLGTESPEGLGLVVALLLDRVPHAAPLLRHLLALSRGTAEGAHLRKALDCCLDSMLDDMSDNAAFDSRVLHAPLRDARQDVHRVAALLRDIDDEPDAAKHRGRLKPIWQNLDQVCRKRFGDGLTEGFVTPLMSAQGSLTQADQTGMETTLRELRALETTARKFGGAKVYDALLGQAAAVARNAADAGVLTRVRHMRLMEILEGPEAAEALYTLGA